MLTINPNQLIFSPRGSLLETPKRSSPDGKLASLGREMLQDYISWAIKEIFKGSFDYMRFSPSAGASESHPRISCGSSACPALWPEARRQLMKVERAHVSHFPAPYKALFQGTRTQMASTH